MKNSSKCLDCPGGTYSANSSSSSCKKFPAGTYSKPGSSSCTNCPLGHYSPIDGSDKCIEYEPGNYTYYFRSKTCNKYPAGYYSNKKEKPDVYHVLLDKLQIKEQFLFMNALQEHFLL